VSVATSLAERATERGRARRRSRLRLVLVLLALVGVLAALAWLVLWSSILGVAQVEVTGTARLSATDVTEQAAIRPGTPLARLDSDAVAERISSLPVVEHVEVHRSWPRSVEIVVRERTGAAVRPIGESWQLVDRTGVVFATQSTRPDGLPLVSAPAGAGRSALRATLDVLDSLSAQVRRQVREVRAVDDQHVTMRLSHKRSVVWGSSSERAQRKADVLAVLLTRKASVYDVSAPDIPTTRK
jgi:cell division protein FtsQ